MTRAMTVYFVKPVGMDGPIKIGCTTTPAARIESLTIWSPFPLEVLVTIPVVFGKPS